MKKTHGLLYAVLLLAVASCTSRNQDDLPEQTQGYKPIYASASSTFKAVNGVAARPTVRGGKLYTVGNLLYQVELDSGIHVINYANPSQPQRLGFIRSFLCKELAVKNGLIYTNNLSDLVVIDASNINNVREVGRVANAFPDLALQSPPADNTGGRVYFECADPAKGLVAGWQLTTLHRPQCWK